jgi:CubicO group peptidase (beta-lactamase class C family)
MARSAIVALVVAVQALSAAPPGSIRRLDGSRIGVGDVDATVTRLMGAADVTGVGVAIFNNGKPVHVKAYGLRDVEKRLPLTPDSVMSAASLTKATFACMVMQLVEERILDLDAPIERYLTKPLVQHEGYESLARDDRYKTITARMLLSHTAGFANLRALEPGRQITIHFDPGTRFAYSGQGLQLLQLVVEAATGAPLADLMHARIFVPLRMTRTSMTWQPQFENDFANGYDEYGRSLGPQRRPRADAAGSMQTTLADVARLMQSAREGSRLRARTRDLMFSQQIAIHSKRQFPTLAAETTEENRGIDLGYGLGWGVFRSPHGPAFFKEGHDEGWRHYAVMFSKPGDGMVIMTNSSNGEGIFKALLETLQRNTFTPIEWEGYTPYEQLPRRKALVQRRIVIVDPKVLGGYVGRYRFAEASLVVRRSGNHLSIQENDETPQELVAESERVFFSTVADDVYTFAVDASGRATQMTLQTGGREYTIVRVE